MNNQELKKALAESYQLEAQLIELLKECFIDIFKKHSMNYYLNQNINNFDEEQIIYGLDYFKQINSHNQQEHENWIKNKELEKQK